jgi:N-carbamoylputrescine amidase
MTDSNNDHRLINIAVCQFFMADNPSRNIERASDLVREAAAGGAHVVLLPELFQYRYFPREMRSEHFALARTVGQSESVIAMTALARQLGVIIPVSFFEKDGDCYFNSLALVSASGECMGLYRKSHIPDGAGYEEKYYFQPGDTGFRVFETEVGTLGIGICWDQWFPETARILTLLGADVLLFPTAIGSEPDHPAYATREPWRRAMLGHAASNAAVIGAANRVGQEGNLRFYGSSFIADQRGEMVAELGIDQEGVAIARIDLAQVQSYRKWLGIFADRRPELYGVLGSPLRPLKDGL